LDGLHLRYITHRLKDGEIRQNYYFFARLKNDRELKSNEGILKWVPYEKVSQLQMPISAYHMLQHYVAQGRFTNELYAGITRQDGTNFVPMKEFED